MLINNDSQLIVALPSFITSMGQIQTSPHAVSNKKKPMNMAGQGEK